MNIIAYIILVLLDAFSYGFCFEYKIQGLKIKHFYLFSFFEIVYTKTQSVWCALFILKEGKYSTTRYRIWQKVLEILFLILIYCFSGFWAAMGILWAHYWISLDYGYYVVLHQLADARAYADAPWLRKWYQAGWIFLKPYKYWKFKVCAYIGIAGLIISNFIKIKVF